MGFADHDVRVLSKHVFNTAVDGPALAAAGAALAGGWMHVLAPLAAVVSILWMGFQWYHSTPMREWRAQRRARAEAVRQRPGRALRSFAVWCHALLLALFACTGEVAQVLGTYLPSLAPYLPEHVHKWVGLAVVVLNIVGAVQRRRKPARTTGTTRTPRD